MEKSQRFTTAKQTLDQGKGSFTPVGQLCGVSRLGPHLFGGSPHWHLQPGFLAPRRAEQSLLTNECVCSNLSGDPLKD